MADREIETLLRQRMQPVRQVGFDLHAGMLTQEIGQVRHDLLAPERDRHRQAQQARGSPAKSFTRAKCCPIDSNASRVLSTSVWPASVSRTLRVAPHERHAGGLSRSAMRWLIAALLMPSAARPP